MWLAMRILWEITFCQRVLKSWREYFWCSFVSIEIFIWVTSNTLNEDGSTSFRRKIRQVFLFCERVYQCTSMFRNKSIFRLNRNFTQRSRLLYQFLSCLIIIDSYKKLSRRGYRFVACDYEQSVKMYFKLLKSVGICLDYFAIFTEISFIFYL